MNLFCKGNTAVCMAGLGGKSSPGSVLLLAVTQAELVKEVLCQGTFWDPHVAQVAELVPQLLHGLDLLVQGAGPQEVTQVGVTAVGGQLVQVEQALVDVLLYVQSILHGFETTLPLLGLRLPDVMEGDAAPTPVLQGHQALSPLAMLVGVEQEEAGEVL